MEALVNTLNTSIIAEDDTTIISTTLDGNADLVKEKGWSILTSLREKLADVILDDRGKRNFQIVLNYMVEKGNHKEILFSLLETCQAFTSTSLFILVLPFLTKTVLLMRFKQISLDIILETVSSHTKGIPWHEDYCLMVENVEGVEVLSAEESMENIAELVLCINNIVVELAEPIWEGFSSDYSLTEREMFINFLLQFLNYPLLYLHPNEDIKSCCLHIVQLLQKLVPTLSTLLEHYANHLASNFTVEQLQAEPVKDALADTSVIPGIGCLSYLVFCADLSIDYFPCVFTSTYRVSLLLPYLNDLYKLSTNLAVLYKVQDLMSSLLKLIPSDSVDEDLASIPSLRSFIPFCFWCMQYCELSPLRKTASVLLKEFISKFTVKSKFITYNWILETERNPDILGYTYTQIKDVIHLTWQDDCRHTSELQKYGGRLISQIYKAPDIADGNGGNLMDDLSKIASALNLALYLVLRDKRRSSPYTADMAKYIREFIEPIGSLLKSEVDQLKARLAALSAEPAPAAEDGLPICSLTIGSQTITHNSQLEKEAIEAAIAKLDLVLYNHSMLKDTLES